MINESKFIDSIKRYDISGLEFESIDEINQIIAYSMKPFNKRGINDNEFTVINIPGHEIINDDIVLNLFNAIPPGPKEMDRHRTHLVVGRYSQAIMPVVLFHFKNQSYVLVQKRQPLNLGLKSVTELFRDYIPTTDGKYSFDKYFNGVFKEIISLAEDVKITNSGCFWENTGVMGSNIAVYICDLDFKNSKLETKDIDKLLSHDNFSQTNNIIGSRELKLIPIDNFAKIRGTKSTADEYFLEDYLSITGLFCLFRYLNKLGG